jgi:hypothetical protein
VVVVVVGQCKKRNKVKYAVDMSVAWTELQHGTS